MPTEPENELDMNTTLEEFLDLIVKMKQSEIKKLTEENLQVLSIDFIELIILIVF